MATITQGTITMQIPDLLQPPPQAGKLSAKEMQRTPKARRGIGQLCVQAAEAVERAGSDFAPPPGVTAQSLRDAAERAESIGAYIVDVEVLLRTLKQTNLLFHAEAWKAVRQVNDQVKAQVRHNPGLAAAFQPLLDTFASFGPVAAATSDEEDEARAQPEAPPPAA